MQLERIFSYLFGSIFLLSVFQAIKNAHPARREPDERVGQRAGFSVLLRAGILPGATGFLRAACLLFGAFGFLRAALLLGAALLLRTLRFLSAALLHTGSRCRGCRSGVLGSGHTAAESHGEQGKSKFLHISVSFYGLGF